MMYRPTGDWNEFDSVLQHNRPSGDLATHVESPSLVLVGCCRSWFYFRRTVASVSEFAEYTVAVWATCSPSKAWAMTHRR
jgi:hypothetical protein